MTRPALQALADRVGIIAEYRDIYGRQRITSDTTKEAILSTLDIDASSEETAELALARIEQEERERLVDSVAVMPQNAPATLTVRTPRGLDGGTGTLDYVVEIREEAGSLHTRHGSLTFEHRTGSTALSLPAHLPAGYHTIAITLDGPQGPVTASQTRIVCPDSCFRIEEVLGGRGGFGVLTNLYTIRSRANWGVGDLADLRDVVAWAAEQGAVLVGTSPLHALRNRDDAISPYSPVSRLFRNLIYLDIPAVPEFAESDEARLLAGSRAHRDALARLRQTDLVQYEEIAALKRRALELLHAEFASRHGGRTTDRGREYARYLERQGEELTTFATFLALEEHFADHHHDWHEWPAAYRDRRSSAVEGFRREHADEISFHCYVQFELDRQLSVVGESARRDLAIGLYGDLAVGSVASGFETWAFPRLFASGAHLGAPPDDFSSVGQNWHLPPVDPRRLVQDGYRYWTLLLRSALAHVGALRIDHVMGLTRQYWIPHHLSGADGAYVRYPTADLLGILALESQRHRVVIVGEDLGTVPEGFSDELRRWGVLSTRVLYFERDGAGEFRPASEYSPRALVSVNTHDHAPLAGFWTGRDLELRRSLGLLDDEALQSARDQREAERKGLVERLIADGVLPPGADPQSPDEVHAAVNAFLAGTPSPLVAVALDDLAGERDPVNVPGVPPTRYANWSRRLCKSLDELRSDAAVRGALDGLRDRRWTRDARP